MKTNNTWLFNCTMVKMDRYGGNETQRLYECCPNYALILGNGLDFLWRRENPDFSEFLLQWSRTDRVYTDWKNANNTKSNHIMSSFADHYHAISIDGPSSKTKIGKGSLCFKNSILFKPEF